MTNPQSILKVLGLLWVVGCASSHPDRHDEGLDAAVNPPASADQRDGKTDSGTLVCDPLHEPPLTKCGEKCVNSMVDVQNCGGCGFDCSVPNADSSCAYGKCSFTCKIGFADCNPQPGCEAALDVDDANCGACGNSCSTFANTQASCVAGSCSTPQCKTPFQNCEISSLDCETNVQTDGTNCGSCGHACLGGGCAGGQCCSWKVGQSCVSTESQAGIYNCIADCVLPGGQAVEAGRAVGSDGLRRGHFRILVLSTTLEYHHPTIPTALAMLKDLGETSDAELMQIGAPAGSQWTVVAAGVDPQSTDYFAEFTAENLKNYEMIFFDNPSGPVFTLAPNGAAEKEIFQNFMLTGGAWAGQHSAIDFENNGRWTWFQDQIDGGWLVYSDADGTPGTLVWEPDAATHPILRGLDSPWNVTDEWYTMNRPIESVAGFQILAKVTIPSSRVDPTPRAAIWIHELDGGGRAFYTLRGHNKTVYAEPAFRKLMLQGVLWAVHRLK